MGGHVHYGIGLGFAVRGISSLDGDLIFFMV